MIVVYFLWTYFSFVVLLFWFEKSHNLDKGQSHMHSSYTDLQNCLEFLSHQTCMLFLWSIKKWMDSLTFLRLANIEMKYIVLNIYKNKKNLPAIKEGWSYCQWPNTKTFSADATRNVGMRHICQQIWDGNKFISLHYLII